MLTENEIKRRARSATRKIVRSLATVNPNPAAVHKLIGANPDVTKPFVDECFSGIPENDKEQQFAVLNELYNTLTAKHKELQKNTNRNIVEINSITRVMYALEARYEALIGPEKTQEIMDTAREWDNFLVSDERNPKWPTITKGDFDAHQNRGLAAQNRRLAEGPTNTRRPEVATGVTANQPNGQSRAKGIGRR